jgi:hypothetical protein
MFRIDALIGLRYWHMGQNLQFNASGPDFFRFAELGRSPCRRAISGMSENIKNRSLSITADVQIPEGGANGVILSQAGRRFM